MTGYWLKINLFYKKYWWLTPLTFFILWRLLLQFIGWVTINTIINIPNPWPADPWPPMWARWDSGWYSSIVTEGYNIQANSLSNTTFFPLYPLLWKIVWTITGWPRLIVGVVISNLAALAATLVFYRWAAIKYGLAIARKTLILWLAFPTSFFLISAYSESLFALLVALVLLTVHNKKWTAAAVIACLASATRPIGIVLWPWLLYCYWRESDGKKTINPWLIFIPPLGLIIFSLYLWQTTGDPLAWLHQQSSYQRSWQNPLELMANYIYLLFYGGKYWLFHVGEITALIFSGWLLVRLFRQDLNLALLSLFLLTPALFTGILTSFPRFVIVVLPLFVALAQVNKPYLIYIYYAIALPLLVKGVGNFIVSRWVA